MIRLPQTPMSCCSSPRLFPTRRCRFSRLSTKAWLRGCSGVPFASTLRNRSRSRTESLPPWRGRLRPRCKKFAFCIPPTAPCSEVDPLCIRDRECLLGRRAWRDNKRYLGSRPKSEVAWVNIIASRCKSPEATTRHSSRRSRKPATE
jgi:hypothetical protein